MTTYNTGNPIGSKDPRDLYDNAENLDEAVNTRAAESWDDRFGVARKTWWGMEQDFQDFLINSGYENIGDYGPGLEITARNQIFWRDGELYRAGAILELPYTTTGVWADEEGLFVAVGDQALRSSLSSDSLTSGGAILVARTPITVGGLSSLSLIQTSVVDDGRIASIRGESFFELDKGMDHTKANGVTIVGADAGCFVQKQGVLRDSVLITVGDGGQFTKIQDALDHLKPLTPVVSGGDHIAEIRLLSGFYMREEVSLFDADLSWVVITSEDEVVPVDRSSIVTPRDEGGRPVVLLIPAVFFICNAIGPAIGATFLIDDSEGLQVDGIVAYDKSHVEILPGCGINKAGRTNLYVVSNSTCRANQAIFDGHGGFSSYGVYAGFNSRIDFEGGTAKGCRRHNIRSRRGCIINAEGATSQGNVEGYGVYSSQGSVITIDRAHIQDAFGDGAVFSSEGSTVSGIEVTMDNVITCVCFAHQSSSIVLFDMVGTNIQRDGFRVDRGSIASVGGANLTGPLTGYGITAQRGANVNAEGAIIKNCGAGGMRALSGASITAPSIDLSGSAVAGAFANGGSFINVSGANLSNCDGNGLEVRNGSRFEATGANLTNATSRGITANGGCSGNAQDANCSGAGVQGASIFSGSTLNARGLTGTLSQTANSVTSNGIIFQ